MRENASFRVDVQINPVYATQVDDASLQAAVAAAVQHTDAPVGAGLTLVITGDKEIRRLNRQFRQVNAPTDVLAFPAAVGAPFVEVPGQSLLYLGDVVVSYPRAVTQAAEAGHSVETELALLAVHGTLHLLGYDHATPEEKGIMWTTQKAVLAGLGLELSTEVP